MYSTYNDFNDIKESSIKLLEESVLSYAGLRGNPVDLAHKSLSESQNFVLPLCLIGMLRSFSFNEESYEYARQCLSKIEEIIQSNQITISSLELQHYSSFKLWLDYKTEEVVKIYSEILESKPYDLLSLKLVSDILFFCGNYIRLLEITQSCVDKINNGYRSSVNDQVYGYILGIHSFALEENGKYESAYETAIKALSINKYDSWAVHAVAHVHEMKSEWQEGYNFLSSHTEWVNCNLMSTHIWWHKALFCLELGKIEEAWTILHEHIYNGYYSPMDLIDATSLLWRFELLDISVDDKEWKFVEKHWSDHIDSRSLTFNLAHAIMAYSRANNIEKINYINEVLTKDDNNAQLLCKSIFYYCQNDYLKTICLMPDRKTIKKYGGSNAQRDIFCKTRINATKKLYDHYVLIREKAKANPNLDE